MGRFATSGSRSVIVWLTIMDCKLADVKYRMHCAATSQLLLQRRHCLPIGVAKTTH